MFANRKMHLLCIRGGKFFMQCGREIASLRNNFLLPQHISAISAGVNLVNTAFHRQYVHGDEIRDIQKRFRTSGADWVLQKKRPGISEDLVLIPQECAEQFMAESKCNKMWDRGSQKDKVIALFTSGGDSQGMNAAIRAAVRMGLYLGCKMYFIKEGYEGMVNGGDYIVEAYWASVSSIIGMGGTTIGSARCQEFRTQQGQLKAAKNLVSRGIQNLIVIGGDGTLTGAHEFRQLWPSLLDELLKNGEITKEQRENQKSLNIAGLVGSIDNDFCGTDMTIGSDSALHRITEAVDAIAYTAYSHQRTFIMEVMGRHCGYLALVAAIAAEADYVFIPENPPPEDWEQKLCAKLSEEREAGKRLNIIIVAEGATDVTGKPIKVEDVRQAIVKNLHQDARVTILGHIQRGGRPSAFDRVLGSRMGAEALMAICESTPESEPFVITLSGNQAIRLPLMDCVNRTKEVAKAMKENEFQKAVELRGKSFTRNLETFKMLAKLKPPDAADHKPHTFGVVHVGAPAGGMNAAVRSFVRNMCYHGHKVIGIHNGFEGFVQGLTRQLKWSDVIGWVAQGGALMGTKRSPLGTRLSLVADKIEELNLSGLLIIGGFEAFEGALRMYQNRDKYPQYNIPIVVIPATISNNVPGTHFSLGCDTALNEITEICDRIRQSAAGTKRRVFIVETMGGYCGYLATLSGLAGGADAAYIFEEKYTIKDLEVDVDHMATKMASGIQRGLILRNEHSSRSYDTSFIHKLYSEEGRGLFSSRMNVLGHMQQGGSPSPFDRNQATKMGAKAANWLANKVKDMEPSIKVSITGADSVVVLGIVGKRYRWSPVETLAEDADFEHRMPKTQWWLKLRPLLRILAQHDSIYEEEGVYMTLAQAESE